jgi:WXG100 family type VII secretion target
MADVRMNYGSMEQMAKSFHQAHEQLEQTIGEMDKVVKMMEGGALVGDGGQAFMEALNHKLKKRLQVLKEKMRELEGDVHGAVARTRDGVQTAKTRFQD